MDGSISVQYIYKEIATFCSTYFSSKVGTIHNRVQRNDDKGVRNKTIYFLSFILVLVHLEKQKNAY